MRRIIHVMLRVGRPLVLVSAAAALLLSSSSRAQQSCPGGRFVLTAPAGPPIERTLLVIDADGRPTSVTGCRKIESQKATSKWALRAKLSDCTSRPTRRRLKGRWTSECKELEVRIRSKQLRRNLIAKPSVC